jgi:flagella basal body P-ring formation protein FlgA
MNFLVFLSLMSATVASGACLPVSGDRILGRDLALVDPKFSSLPPALPLGYAPVPGTTRVFAALELQRIARANGIPFTDNIEVCFEVAMHVPTDAEFVEAIRHSLPPAASLQLVDMGRSAIPTGKLEFPLAGLEPPAVENNGAQLWRGFVQYTDTRRLPIWARVTVKVAYAAVIPRKDLAADIPIEAAALLVETKTGPLKREATATRIEDVAGHIVRRSVMKGAEIPIALLEEPPAVRRGDLVRIEVQSGSAVLRFDAIAESTVRAGELADFRNPVSGKTFRARAEAGSKALVVVGRGLAL